MTQNDAYRYAEAKKDWEYKKRHVFLFSHDDRLFSNWWKSSRWLSKGMLMAYGGMVFVFVLLGLYFCALAAQVDLKVLIVAGIIPIALILVIMVYDWIFWTNYCRKAHEVFLIVFMLIPGGLAYICPNGFRAIAFLIATFLGLKVCKNAFFTLPEPQVEDFDSERDSSVM